MPTLSQFARTAASIGDPGRAVMLWSLMDGRALTAGELATQAGVSNSTASEHLAELRETGLVRRIINGRHHYYRIASAEVASLLEQIMNVAAVSQQVGPAARGKVRCGPADPELRQLRRCYDHLAGAIAVRITDVMTKRNHLQMNDEAAILTSEGESFLTKLGLVLHSFETGQERRAAFCRPCLDWSERRYHLAGRVGASLYRTLEQAHWIRVSRTDRALRLTPHGTRELERHFGIRTQTN